MRRAGLVAVIFGLLAPAVSAQVPATLGREFAVNVFTAGEQALPALAADAAGGSVIVWQAGAPPVVSGRLFDAAGAARGGDFQVTDFGPNAPRNPTVASSDAGSFVVLWYGYVADGSAEGVRGQRFDALGSRLGSAFQVNTYTTGPQLFPVVASEPDGDFVAAWQSYTQDGSISGIYATRYSSNGVKRGSEFRVNTWTTNSQAFPAIATDSTGFVVVWESNAQDGDLGGIFGQRFESTGLRRGGEFRVNSYTTSLQASPSVSIDALGGFTVVWEHSGQDGSGSGVYAQRYDVSGAPLGAEQLINSYTLGFQQLPSVSTDADGGFLVAWDSVNQDGSGSGVYAQRHYSDGRRHGSEFRVNSWTTLGQGLPTVRFGVGGGFVVVWQSDGQDGAGNGIYAQRYSARSFVYRDTLQGSLPVPDNNASGITDVINITDAGTILDLDVELGIGHTFVGDLRITLTHLNTGRSVTLLDRPGLPPLPNGCDGQDIAVALDDGAASPAEGQCADPPPAIAGILQPGQPLDAFNGESITGLWELRVVDLQAGEQGSLQRWALVVELSPPPFTPTPPASPTITPTPTPTLPPVGGEPPFLAENFAVKDVRALWPEQDSLWVGTPSGLLLWSNPAGGQPVLTTYNPTGSGLTSWDVRSLARTHDGKVWAATAESGLASFDGVAWRYYNSDNTGSPQGSLSSDQVTALAVDPRWVVKGANVLAVELHQSDLASSDMSFDLELAGALPGGGSKVIVPRGAMWRYLDTGVDLGTDWRKNSFPDGPWKNGPAQLGFGDGDEATLIASGNVTVYFRHHFTVADPAEFASLSLALLRDDGAAVYLNGREVARSNLPARALASTFATAVIGGADESAFFPFPVGPANAAEIWAALASPAAIARYDGTNWVSTLLPVPGRGGTTTGQVNDLAVGSDGLLWGATADLGGLSFDGTQMQFYGQAENLPLNLGSVTVDLLGRVWFGSIGSGVSRLDGPLPFQDIGPGLPSSFVADLDAGPDGTVWCMPDNSASSRGSGPSPVYFDETAGGWASPPGISLPASALLSKTAVGPDGLVWIGSENSGTFGIAGFGTRGTGLVTLQQKPAPRCTDVPALVLDATRSLWAGCSNEGLSRYDGTTWTAFNSSNTAGITSDAVTSAAFEPPDTLWFGTLGGGVLRRQAGVFSALTATNGLASNAIQAVAVAPDGTKWFATAGGNGVSRLQGVNFRTFSTSDGLLDNNILSIGVEPSPGVGVWFAASNGLNRYDGSTFLTFRTGSSQPGDFQQGGFPGLFTEVRVSPDGTVWAGTMASGAVYYKGGVWRALDTAHGLPERSVRSIAFDADGATWLGVTDPSGTRPLLVKWADGEILERITADNGLPSGAIQDLAFDPRTTGRLWAGTARNGVLTLHASENRPVALEAPVAEDIGCSSVQLRWSRYTGDGFAGYQVLRASGDFVGAGGLGFGLALFGAVLAIGVVALRGRARVLAASACGLLVALAAGAAGRDEFEPIQTLELRSQRAFTDLTVQDGGVYRYRVDVLQVAGRKALNGPPVLVEAVGQVPAAPELGFLSASSTEVHLNWPAPQTQGQCPATRLELESRQQEGPFSVLAANLPPTAEDDFANPGRTPSTRYRYRLRAFNANGASPYSPVIDVTTSANAAARGECQPPPPVRLRARALGSDRIALSWADPARRFGCPQEGVNVYRVVGQTEVLAATVGAGENRAQEAQRNPKTTYTYVVRARRGPLQSDASAPAQVTTPQGSVRIFVPGDLDNVRTGLVVAPGASVRVAAVSGEVRFNTILDYGSLVSPQGFDRVNFITQWPDDAAIPDPLRAIDEGHAGLMAIIDGQSVFVGQELNRVSTLGGEVRLAVNDVSTTLPAHLRNTGGFVVDVSSP